MGTVSEAPSWGCLLAISGPYTERIFTVGFSGGLIGRSRKCAISLLHDCEVSHNHAVIESHGGQLCLRDVGSTFGTYLNDSAHRHILNMRPLLVGSHSDLRARLSPGRVCVRRSERLSEPKRASDPYTLKPSDSCARPAAAAACARAKRVTLARSFAPSRRHAQDQGRPDGAALATDRIDPRGCRRCRTTPLPTPRRRAAPPPPHLRRPLPRPRRPLSRGGGAEWPR